MAGILPNLAAFKYMSVGISEPVIANGVSDHVHILSTAPPAPALADIMRALKAKSPGWLRRTSPSFAWQAGYAAFSVSESNAGHVKRYIAAQEEHHRKAGFDKEFLLLLKRHKLAYDERYLWSWRNDRWIRGPSKGPSCALSGLVILGA